MEARAGKEFAGTVEAWARQLVRSTELGWKLAPPAAPDAGGDAAWERAPEAERIGAPGRPPELTVGAASPKTPKPGALVRPAVRARLVHTFLHHEVQAAELMAWALLAFPDTPRELRAGLVAIAGEELRHARLYRAHLGALGHDYGDFPVRDWFWERVPACETPLAFLAVMGMGLEGGNLEHTRRFAAWFRAAGDERGAELLERIGREEIGHVRFATRWFRRWTGGLDFDEWARRLPPPLSPLLMRGLPLDRDARTAGGMEPAFLARLEAWSGEPSGS